MAETTFWFAEFEVEGTLTTVHDFDPTKSREERIRESILQYVGSQGPVTESTTGEWYFGATQDEVEYLLGKFGKVYSDEPITYDEEIGDFIDEGQPNVEADYSMFILHFDKQLLIYNTRNRVGYQQFRRNFANGYSELMGGDVQMNIQFLYNTADVETVLEEFPVYHAQFELEPSNPQSDPDWDALDDHMKEMLAQKLGVDIDALEGESLNFDDEFLAQLSAMSQSEYGEYTLVYDEDGYIKALTSEEDEPIRKEHEEPDTLGGLKERASELIGYASTFLE